MTKASNAKMLVGKCSCGKIARGSELKKHLKEKEGTMGHERKVMLRLCVSCRKCVMGDEKEFMKAHLQCESGNIGEKGFKAWFEGELLEREEVRKAVAAIQDVIGEKVVRNASEGSSSDGSSNEEVELRANMKKKDDVDLDAVMEDLFGDIADLKEEWEGEEVAKPMAASSPRQQEAYDTEVFVRMKDRVMALESNNRKVLKENEELKVKVEGYRATREELESLRKKEKEWMAERSELMRKAGLVESLRASVSRKDEEIERMRSVVKETEEVKVINKRLTGEVERLHERLKCRKRRVYEVHLPLFENNICDAPTITDDPNVTQQCYEGDGVRCLHMSMDVTGQLEDFVVRKVRKKVPSKLPQHDHFCSSSNLLFFFFQSFCRSERSVGGRRTTHGLF